jgi:hypothetical protein
MPYSFRPDSLRNLTRIFPPDRGADIPTNLSNVVNLTHDALGTISYVAVSIFIMTGSSDQLSVTQANAVPEGFIWIVDHVHFNITDATPRVITLYVHYINPAGDFSIAVGAESCTTPANVPVRVQAGRFIMPPASKIEISVPALTGGARIRVDMAFLAVPAGQFVPRT